MPDFFLDRLVNVGSDLKTFCKDLRRVSEKKGGSIDNITQMELRGGNAINAASALAELGVRVTPIVCTNKHGLQLLKSYLRSDNIDLSHVKIFDKVSITTAIELEAESGKTNVMLRDVGALANFNAQHLSDDDFKAIATADYVCVFNWAGTRRFGTKLAETVFRHAKKNGRAKTYYDTADPTPNKEKIPDLVNLLRSKHIDILSANENEAISYASYLACKTTKKGKESLLEKQARQAARVLAENLTARIDLHTTSFSATFVGKTEIVVPAFNVHALRSTGAGDAWNAGNIIGDANKLSDDCRLALANAVAAYYISNPNGTHPTRKQLLGFCERLSPKRK